MIWVQLPAINQAPENILNKVDFFLDIRLLEKKGLQPAFMLNLPARAGLAAVPQKLSQNEAPGGDTMENL